MSMNNAFTEHWLLQAEAGNARLMVYQLLERDQQWIANPHGSWDEFMGTPEALHSLSQAETTVVLNLPSTQDLENPESGSGDALWCCIQHAPVRCTTAPLQAQHRAVKTELERQGKQLEVIQCDRLNDWCRAARFVEIDVHEAKAIQTWANSINSPAATSIHYLLLAVKLYGNTAHNVLQKRMSMVLLAGVLLGIFHWHLNKPIPQASQPIQNTAQQKTDLETTLKPDWLGWQVKQKKFGENRQANITHMQLAWRNDGSIYSQAELQKPRKRMPKGCQTFEPLPRIECTHTPNDALPGNKAVRP